MKDFPGDPSSMSGNVFIGDEVSSDREECNIQRAIVSD
jgi:hypothetical protein